MNKKILFSLLALLSTFSYAQDNEDFGMDYSIGVDKKISKRVGLEVDANLRTQDDCSKVERWGVGAGFDIKLYSSKKFDVKANAGWEYLWQNKLPSLEDKFDGVDKKGYNESVGFWQGRHRTSLGVGASYKPNKRWEFSYKEMVQYNHYNSADSITYKYRLNDDDEYYLKSVSGKDCKDRFVLRSKLNVQYDIKHSMFAPFASVDYGCGLNYSTSKWKLTAGTDLKINKKNKLSVFYRFQTENDDDEPNGHIIGLGYNIKIN